MSKLFRLSAALAATTMLATGSAHAATAESTMTVSASVTALCEVTAPTLAFATDLNWNSATATAVDNISVKCTQDTPYTISVGDGQNLDVKRRMKYTDATPTDHFMPYTLTNMASEEIAVLPDATNSNYDLDSSFSGNGDAQLREINGEVLDTDLDSLPAGSYTDQVAVTVHY